MFQHAGYGNPICQQAEYISTVLRYCKLLQTLDGQRVSQRGAAREDHFEYHTRRNSLLYDIEQQTDTVDHSATKNLVVQAISQVATPVDHETRLTELERALKVFQQGINSKSTVETEQLHKYKATQARLEEELQNLTHKSTLVDDLQAKLKINETKCTALETSVKQAREENVRLQLKLHEINEQQVYKDRDLQQRLEQSQEQHTLLEYKIRQKDSRLTEMQDVLQQQEQITNETTIKLHKVTKQLQQLQDERQHLEENVLKWQQRESDLLAQVKREEVKSTELQNALKTAQNENNDLNGALHDIKKQFDTKLNGIIDQLVK